jgi:hypothetical protein
MPARRARKGSSLNASAHSYLLGLAVRIVMPPRLAMPYVLAANGVHYSLIM